MNLVPAPTALRGVGARLRSLVPEGRRLPDPVWRRRHRGILVLLWIHAVGIAVFAAVRQFDAPHVVLEAGAGGAPAVLAGVFPRPPPPRRPDARSRPPYAFRAACPSLRCA